MKQYRFASFGAVLLAFVVVIVGAYTRLTDSGLGCPDWPGCYGQLVLPSQQGAVATAQKLFPHIPIEARKAWTEMAHRYAAGTLLLLVFYLGFNAWRLRGKNQPWRVPAFLMFLIGFQAAMGMWTVTMKLLPVVVMGHLLGGVLIFVSLVLWCWQLQVSHGLGKTSWRLWLNLGIVLLFCQIALGGWVSSNYAGLACVGFPRCNGQWLPTLYLKQSFQFFSDIGSNHQGGLLDSPYRVTIQMIHRIGACVVALYIFGLCLIMWCKLRIASVRWMLAGIGCLLLLQLLLGVVNVMYLLPLWAAVAHNGVAAWLLASLVSLRYWVVTGDVYAPKV